ncbi:hypothetical protein LTR56_027514 [Elasticomyces elasticus]|nr:hypothetical protein LTR56_027514 [Elasticomyces elasticus]KAK3617362.1 hypothetical protein LTR22_026765 [Elasticomyces elasticus]
MSHKLQPCDIAVFAPLKTVYRIARIKEMMLQLEEMKARTTTISKEAQESKQKKDGAVALAAQLEAEVQEAKNRISAAAFQESEESETKVKKRTATLLGTVGCYV